MSLSKDEAALYDRQIRLWGVEAQKRIGGSTVVVAGLFTGVAQELVKNLVLKGVCQLLLLTFEQDESLLLPTEGMLFAPGEGKTTDNAGAVKGTIEKATLLNPTVRLVGKHVQRLADAEQVLHGASMMILVNERRPQMALELDGLCRKQNCCFEWILTGGFDAILINDFGGEHRYLEEIKTRDKDGETVIQRVTRSIHFPDLATLWQRHLQLGRECESERPKSTPPSTKARPISFSPLFKELQGALERDDLQGSPTLEHFLTELPPVNAIIGALAAQETLKAITSRDLPLHNIVLFDGRSMDSTIISIE